MQSFFNPPHGVFINDHIGPFLNATLQVCDINITKAKEIVQNAKALQKDNYYLGAPNEERHKMVESKWLSLAQSALQVSYLNLIELQCTIHSLIKSNAGLSWNQQ